MSAPTDLRIYAILEALKHGWEKEKIDQLTQIHMWFLDRLRLMRTWKRASGSEVFGRKILLRGKEDGLFRRADCLNNWARDCHGTRNAEKGRHSACLQDGGHLRRGIHAQTPYYYSSYENENESVPTARRKVAIIGSGPIRIGQGIEFDYCCCHAAFALREMGIESIMINNNPETVSTDFDTSDRLYFEPLTFEDV